MKKINRLSILALSLSLALVACGKNNKESQKETVKETIKETNKEKAKDIENGGLSLVRVVKLDELKNKNVVEIAKHGDHWHVYTKEGEEFLTYEDPSKAFKDIKVKEYVGNHGDHKHGHSNGGKTTSSKNQFSGKTASSKAGTTRNSNKNTSNEEEKVVRIAKHGDHYHLYTNKGNEYITYTNPSAQYPGIKIETYHGSHGHGSVTKTNKTNNSSRKTSQSSSKKSPKNSSSHAGSTTNKPSNSSKKIDRNKEIEGLKITNILGKPKVNRFDIVRILKHEDHYHIYDSKGNEGIVYENPQELYPNAQYGEYEGDHGDSNKANNKENNNNLAKKPEDNNHDHSHDNNHDHSHDNNHDHSHDNNHDHSHDHSHDHNSGEKIEWPEGVTKIWQHGDHYHLYINEEEIGIVHEDPRPHYPNAEFIPDDSNANKDVEVKDSELFTYESISPKLQKDLLPYLDDLKNMTHFGSLKNTDLPVYGTEERENIFYWLHGGHYHAMSIKQIIQNAKAGKYAGHTAKEVVATVKYLIENDHKIEEKEVDFDKAQKVKDYLIDQYKVDPFDVMHIGNLIYVTDPKTSDQYIFNIDDFEIKNNQVTYKKELPGK